MLFFMDLVKVLLTRHQFHVIKTRQGADVMYLDLLPDTSSHITPNYPFQFKFFTSLRFWLLFLVLK
jgi:hypothetical protein